MSVFRMRRLLPGALGAVVLCAQAQGPADPPARRADPLDAAASVPPLLHESAITRHRRAAAARAPDAALPWREANDQVARIGGWRAYAREAQAAPAAAPTPASAAHRGHQAP